MRGPTAADMFYAAREGNVAVARMLISLRMNINQVDVEWVDVHAK